ncbi:PREDICTED: kinesin-like protein KIF23 [Amphimedon queenslandica]|uniref:Kinesin-like protein n=1 Tax=Amphimedon queenslandica TaxID=400682 RepID=A0A1X7VF14_AMPQE|nr:PREDICTED: kinesin-like protein KIF23 [Amphimedon queenslandica]|eukprot:XP_003384468.1 PREDICTED: kinesin-like protein KIF23 [Amphimedon queenslandica]
MASKHPGQPSKPPRKHQSTPKPKQKEKDPVQVYCRLRPLKQDENESCAEVKPPSILQLTPPECSIAYKSGNFNPTQHHFKFVFDGKTSQKCVFDDIAYPLVSNLVLGRNGLLFAYGVTNSGKTYTMTGEQDQPGILPRVMDVLFNTITEVQAPKHVFQPDATNGYKIIPEEEAKLISVQRKPRKISPRAKLETPDYGDLLRVSDGRKVDGIDEDSSYAIFISYVEIYNNFIYDLLEENGDSLHPKPPQSRNIREDTSHNMYVSGCIEVEVKSAEEAFEVLLQGQRKRRVAHTQLNHDSSRSHAVFNIRLVQAPLDPSGAQVLQDDSQITVSQLSLVDLAGSERTHRTCNEGNRVMEAGRINQSLMTLRKCMETLRENQRNGTNKIVPYRDSKLTVLFKNYFDGEGMVRMIVCVSPRAEDYDESIHVMNFAEVTQEVKIDRPAPKKSDIGLAPGRRRANMIYRTVVAPRTPHPYELALGVLCIQEYLSEDNPEASCRELREFLEKRLKTRPQLIADQAKKTSLFREALISTEKELNELRSKCQEIHSLKSSKEKAQQELTRLKGVITAQNKEIAQLNGSIQSFKMELEEKEKEKIRLNNQLTKAIQKNDHLLRESSNYKAQLEVKAHDINTQVTRSAKMTRELEGQVQRERAKFERLAKAKEQTEMECQAKEEKIAQVRDFLHACNSPLREARLDAARSRGNTPLKTSNKENKTEEGTAPLYTKGKAQRKRSLSENWLEHKPTDCVENNDILQPRFKKKKTVTNPKPKHFKSQNVDKYVLKHQEQDPSGDVKTELYKGDILFTRTGGASVKFTDIEKLDHVSPKPSRRITRSLSMKNMSSSSISTVDTDSLHDALMEEEERTDVEGRCAICIEGKPGGTAPALSHISLTRSPQPSSSRH